MRRSFYQRHKGFFSRLDGLLLRNPVLERGLVLAPVVVASYNCENSLLLGLAFMGITILTVFFSSFIPRRIPYTVRTILYILVACAFYVPVAMLMEYLFPGGPLRAGVFLPLLVANSLIIVKSESRFHRQKRGRMLFDLLCSTLGFLGVIVLLGAVRELLGRGTLFGRTVQEAFTVPAVLMPFSGFILVGLLSAAVQKLRLRVEGPDTPSSDSNPS